MWWGALAGTIPDLDVIAVATHGPFGEFLYHRGLTHSLWFGPVVGSALGYAVWRGYARGSKRRARDARPARSPDPGDRRRLGAWISLFVLALFTHPLLDVFTSYGTQLFAPFSTRRFALNGVGIIDLFYTLPLVMALVAGRLRRGAPRLGALAATIALGLTTTYLFYGLALNRRAEADIRQVLATEGIDDASVRAYPTILQPYLRRIVVRTPDEIRVGLYTTLRPGQPVWESFPLPPPNPLVDALRHSPEGRIFRWFAMEETVSHVHAQRDGTVVEIDDLRYGVPGRPDEGMWGIRGFFDPSGQLRGPIERFGRRQPGPTGELLRGLFRATFGDFSALDLRRR